MSSKIISKAHFTASLRALPGGDLQLQRWALRRVPTPSADGAHRASSLMAGHEAMDLGAAHGSQRRGLDVG